MEPSELDLLFLFFEQSLFELLVFILTRFGKEVADYSIDCCQSDQKGVREGILDLRSHRGEDSCHASKDVADSERS